LKTLVIYDISDDQRRLKVSEACKNFGLARIQRSAFLGSLTPARRKELIAVLRRLISEEEDNLQVFVICEPDLALRVVLGKEFREEEAEGVLIV